MPLSTSFFMLLRRQALVFQYFSTSVADFFYSGPLSGPIVVAQPVLFISTSVRPPTVTLP